MTRNRYNRAMDSVIPDAPTDLLEEWLQSELVNYDRLKGHSGAFRSSSLRCIRAIEDELGSRGVSFVRSREIIDDEDNTASKSEKSHVPTAKSKRQVMYVETKPGLSGDGRIGRVQCSKTGKTLYYDGRTLKSLKGRGYKANYVDVKSGLEFWISNCRKDGRDTLYPGVVKIDEDVRKEYWLEIRQQPDLVEQSEFRSEGKYSKRRTNRVARGVAAPGPHIT